MASTHPFPLREGASSVLIGHDGSVAAVTHPVTGRSLLLESTRESDRRWHDASFAWGKGFAILDGDDGRRGWRWDAADDLSWHDDGVTARYRDPESGLDLDVVRRIGATWEETYTLHNPAERTVEVASLAVSTPWRDVYDSAADSLAGAVHAHVWTGGADSYVWAQPMNGAGPGLGLDLIEGELWAYSVESRDIVTMSNVRGHLYLHVTDAGRAPHALGGQRSVVLAPGARLSWTWRLGWHGDVEAFHRSRRAPLLTADRLAAPLGAPMAVRTQGGATVTVEDTSSGSVDLKADTDGVVTITGRQPGEVGLRATDRSGRRSRINVLTHLPLAEIVSRRIEYICRHQVSREKGGARSAAFVPFDRRTGLRQLSGAWRDWNDLRERVGMGLLMQQARVLGLVPEALVDEPLSAYTRFLREQVVADDGTVADDLRERSRHQRLYNFPWFCLYFLHRHRQTADQADLEVAASIYERYYASGGAEFLAFELATCARLLAPALRAGGDDERAGKVESALVGHACHFVEIAEDLPGHEVNYEQSMVAPLLSLLVGAHLLDPGRVPAEEIRRRLPWLTAFAGDQPDVRLRHVPIRHWDGYWFGADRRWGDVFPHYWSDLSADVFLSLPESVCAETELADLRRRGIAILRSNLVAFEPDGFATCAFVYPSAVNGSGAHVADPLANDQDWALYYALRYADLVD